MAKEIEKTPEEKAEALADYQNMSLTTEDIATKYGVSLATITVWAKRAGLSLRKRGRWHQTVPTPLQAEIIKLAEVLTMAEVGEKVGMHKQSVHRIIKRWRERTAAAKPPFEPGDKIVWNRKRYSVVDAGLHDGTVVDEKGKFYKNFKWNASKPPKKIGVDRRYAVAGRADARGGRVPVVQ